MLGYWEVVLKCSNTFITATYSRVEQCRRKVTYFKGAFKYGPRKIAIHHRAMYLFRSTICVLLWVLI